jgi:hypothetical protein
MFFCGVNGMTVCVKGVMFCKNARSNLISPSALLRAKLIIDYISDTDTFVFKSPGGQPLIESPMDAKRQCWLFPQPIHRADSISSTSVSPPSSQIPSQSISSPSFPFVPNSSPPANTSAYAVKPKAPAKAVLPSEPLFQFPVDKFDFDWHESDLTKNEMQLLFWHHLFGHAGLRRIRKMIKLNLGVGLPESIPKGDIKCPVCMIAKGTRDNHLLPTFRPTDKLNILACDLIGPFEIPTFNEGKYVLTIRDIATSYSEVKIMKSKDETADLLIAQIRAFETATGCKVKCLQSDNGGEFESKALADFLKQKGIKTECSLPYHHY